MYKTTKVSIVRFTSFWSVHVRHERDEQEVWVHYHFWKDIVPNRWKEALMAKVREGKAIATRRKNDKYSVTFTIM